MLHIGDAIKSFSDVIIDGLRKLDLNWVGDKIEKITNKVIGVINVIERIIPELIEVFKTTLKEFSKDSGILDEDEDFEEFGLKYSEAENQGINREDYENFDEYKSKLNEINTENIKPESEEASRALELIGMGIAKNELDIKADSNIPESLYIKFKQLNLDPEKIDVAKLGEIVNKYNLTNEKIDGFDKNEISYSSKLDVKDAIVDIVKLVNPEKDRMEILEEYYKNTESNGSIFS